MNERTSVPSLTSSKEMKAGEARAEMMQHWIIFSLILIHPLVSTYRVPAANKSRYKELCREFQLWEAGSQLCVIPCLMASGIL